MTVGAMLGLGAASSALNTGFGLIGQSVNYKQQLKLADLQYNRAVDIMNRQNAYNSPAAQMERLRKAGLNPNLIYGNGSTSTGNGDVSTPAYNPPSPSFNTGTDINLQSAFTQYQQIASWQAQEEAARAQAENQSAQAAYYTAQAFRVNAENPYLPIWFENRKELEGYGLRKAGNEARASDVLPLQRQADLDETNVRIAGHKLDNSVKEFNLNLMRHGVNPTSSNMLSTLLRIGLVSARDRKDLEQVLGRVIEVGVSALGIAAKTLIRDISDFFGDSDYDDSVGSDGSGPLYNSIKRFDKSGFSRFWNRYTRGGRFMR